MTAPSEQPERHPEPTEEKVTQLSDEDVTVSYMGDELDLKTVGDIIAIIEDKVQEYLFKSGSYVCLFASSLVDLVNFCAIKLL